MAGATIADVSLYSKDRGRASVFNLTLDYDGIAIQPPGETPRHLPWTRITEWEIQQRRGGVLLILRGGGAVTPLLIPKWTVDDLDRVLRDVTSGLPDPDVPTERMPFDISIDEVAVPEPELPFTAPVVAATAPPIPARASIPEPAPVAPVEDADLWTESEDPEGLDTVLWPEPAPVSDEPPSVTRAEATLESPAPAADMESGLVWPSNSPLEDVPNLVWPADGEPASSSTPDSPPSDGGNTVGSESSAPWVIEDVPGLPPLPQTVFPRVDPVRETPPPVEQQPKVVRVAYEDPVRPGSPSVEQQPKVVRVAYEDPVRPAHPVQIPPYEPLPAERSSKKKAQPRAERRTRERSGVSTKLIVTVVLLAALATAVALVLAESAGAIHLSFLGT